MILLPAPVFCLRAFKTLLFLTVLVAFTFIIITQLIINGKSFITKQSGFELLAKNTCFIPNSLKKINWHDYSFINYEHKRKGFGEHGKPVHLKKDKIITQTNVFDEELSDKISVNRSLPDTRHPKCKKKLYIESLPSASVIVPFHNKHYTTLLRTLHSIINRSPKQLLKEVIIVDDASTVETLKGDLDSYVAKYLPKVKILRAKRQYGLVRAKLLGAIEATADALVFLEAHTEVNVNWLPPLLEPIALNCRTVMCPTIDMIDTTSFEYKEKDQGHRGGFNWNFQYKKLPLMPNDTKNMPEPFATPVMEGSIFAISRIFFWELGGFDPGLYMSGEQFEISFKIWQCGGRMFKTPCSRVGLIHQSYPMQLKYLLYTRNSYHRIAKVWMDEYADFISVHHSRLFVKNIEEQKALREKLKCLPFNWYMTHVAFDLLHFYPAVEPPSLAEGHIRSVLNKNICVVADFTAEQLLLNECDNEYTTYYQEFVLTWDKKIRSKVAAQCWDLPEKRWMPVHLRNCHDSGNEEWRYDASTTQIIQGEENCLDWNPLFSTLYVTLCNHTSQTQQWEFDVLVDEELINIRNTNPTPPFEFICPT